MQGLTYQTEMEETCIDLKMHFSPLKPVNYFRKETSLQTEQLVKICSRDVTNLLVNGENSGMFGSV